MNISPFLFQTAPFHSFIRSLAQPPITIARPPYRHHNHSARRVAHVLTLSSSSTNKLFLFPSHLTYSNTSPVLTCPHVIPVQKNEGKKNPPFPPFHPPFLSHLAATRWGFRQAEQHHGGTVAVVTFAFFPLTGARPFSAFLIFIFFLVPDSCKVLGS